MTALSYQQIYLTASKSNTKKKKTTVSVAGLPVRRCSCTMEATMWQLRYQWVNGGHKVQHYVHVSSLSPTSWAVNGIDKFCRGTKSEVQTAANNHFLCYKRNSHPIRTYLSSAQLVPVSASTECRKTVQKNTTQVSFIYLIFTKCFNRKWLVAVYVQAPWPYSTRHVVTLQSPC